MADNFVVKDATGQVITKAAKDLGSSVLADRVVIAAEGTAIYGTSDGAAASNDVTLSIPATKLGYLDGFDIDGCGATAGSGIEVTVAGILGGTLTFIIGIPAGATVPVAVSKRFNPPLQCAAVGDDIVVTVPTFGVGNLYASVNAYGHYA